MLLKRRQPDKPAAALNKFCSIRTSNGVYTEFGIDPIELQSGAGSLLPYRVGAVLLCGTPNLIYVTIQMFSITLVFDYILSSLS